MLESFRTSFLPNFSVPLILPLFPLLPPRRASAAAEAANAKRTRAIAVPTRIAGNVSSLGWETAGLLLKLSACNPSQDWPVAPLRFVPFWDFSLHGVRVTSHSKQDVLKERVEGGGVDKISTISTCSRAPSWRYFLLPQKGRATKFYCGKKIQPRKFRVA